MLPRRELDAEVTYWEGGLNEHAGRLASAEPKGRRENSAPLIMR